MNTISERLRAVAPNMLHDHTEEWLREAADTIDALLSLLEQGMRERNVDWYARVDAALSKAKGKQE